MQRVRIAQLAPMRKGTLVLALLLLSLFAAAGCGSGGSDPTSTTAASGPTETAELAETDASAGAAEPKKGGTLTVGIVSDTSGFDPLIMAGAVDELVAWPIYDRLLSLPGPQGEPELLLAESLEPNDDLTEWTMTLKDGITFSDGEPFDAEAVKFNVERHINPDNGSRALAVVEPIESVEVVDDLTVKFHLKQPWANLPVALTFVSAAMASPKAIEAAGKDYTRQPVGTGPYTLTEWIPGDQIVLDRREDYWRDDIGYPDRIVLKVIPDASTRYASLTSGDLDLMIGPGPDEAASADSSGLTWVESPEGVAGASIVAFNLNEKPLDDVRVRQALSYAIDRDALSDATSNGLLAPSEGPFAGTPWDGDVPYPSYDPEKARALVEEYESETGEQISFTYRFIAPTGQQQAELLQAMWSAVGIDAEIEGGDLPTHIGALVGGQFDALESVSGIAPHPDMVFYAFLNGASPLQFTKKADPRIDEALAAARTIADPEVQKQAYHEIDTIMADEVLWAWLTEGLGGYIHSPAVKGSGLSPDRMLTTMVPDLTSEIWVDK